MTRYILTAVLAAALGSAAVAQPPPGTLLPPPPPPAADQPNVYVPPGAPPGPAIPFHKSGGVVVGAYGFFPYDTGDWLTGGTGPAVRYGGSFTMVAPGGGGADAGVVVPAGRGFCGRHGLFRR